MRIDQSRKYKARLQCTQNKVIRFLRNAPARTHIGANEFRKVGMLPVELRVKQLKLNLVHNIINGKAPNYLSESINLTRNQHNINTRSSTLSLQVPYVKSFGKTSFQYTGIQAWNELNCDVQGAISKSSFKYLVKKFLFNYLNNQETNSFIYY